MSMTQTKTAPRVVHKPGLGGWCVYVGSEFVNGAFANREEAEAAAWRIAASPECTVHSMATWIPARRAVLDDSNDINDRALGYVAMAFGLALLAVAVAFIAAGALTR